MTPAMVAQFVAFVVSALMAFTFARSAWAVYVMSKAFTGKVGGEEAMALTLYLLVTLVLAVFAWWVCPFTLAVASV